MPQSNATTMKYFYDDENGDPVDITSEVQSVNEFDLGNVLDNTTPYGVAMPVFQPTGRGTFAPINLGFLFKTGGTIETLFGGRIPESADADTRTFKVQYGTGRTTSVETHLANYKAIPNKDNGLTRSQVVLQPTGEITETFPA